MRLLPFRSPAFPPVLPPVLPLARAAIMPLACGLLLAGCGSDTARTLGFTRDAPDEFSVVTRAPLSLPPTLGDLPPPRPGTPRPQELRGRAAGEATVAPGSAFGVGAATAPSSGEMALLAEAGPRAGSGIRSQVDEESTRLDQPDRSVVDRLMFWRDSPQAGVAVDPRRESQRLRENAALGREPVDGETPVIQRRREGLFERLF
ncbi:hypothetical protein CR162_06345 [Pseudoroseomonas rhizosphaerae]|uniref:Beta-barrel assembly machine subunit BamF n=1 Tax=Teichococcus rhizosphaerae TaxID=1335062 RepID=A0A2C7A6M6_9PROT|nr:DUF3035 domain-containing protein [Pseudoroseomonas rhizosphaerae]PHK95748.1 hypothetical protein CR162_06345 [Pseudoroseomonas rhizosphaerae]